MSQEEMAAETHLSRSTVSRLENNQMEIKAVDLINWFQAAQAPEVAAAIICGVDVAVVTDLLSTVTLGFIKLFGGLL